MINVTKTYLPDKKKYIGYIDQIFESGWLTNNGQFVQKLTQQLCEHFNSPYVLVLSNGTLALQIAFRALNIKKQVITTPFSFVATTSSLIWEGITPVFADVNQSTFNLNPKNIESLINSETTAILPVHVFGNGCEIEDIQEIAIKHNLKVIYDAAHAFSVNYKGQPIVSFGDASVLSFHSTKIFHTIEGGAIVFKDKEAFEKAKLMINFGISGYDQIDLLGINCKMNEFQAAMGLCVFDDIQNIIESRRLICEKYQQSFKNENKLQLQLINSDCNQNYAYFPVVFESEMKMLQIKEILFQHEIFARRYFYPSLESLSYIETRQIMPHSTSLSKRILCLPVFHEMLDKDQEMIIEIIKSNL